MLRAAGLTANEEAVYRFLVTVDTATREDITQRTQIPPDVSERILSGLERKGLVSRRSGAPGSYAASPPDVALQPRLQRRADALEAARNSVNDLLDAYQATRRRHDANQLIELVTGADALRQRLGQIQANAREELLWFCKAQYVAMPSGSNDEEYAALARGVRYRVLYEHAFFDDSGSVDHVATGVRAGESARVAPALPLRMAIADGELAICPLVPGGPGGSPEEPTAALVRDSSLLLAFLALFERYWQDGVPLALSASGSVTRVPGESGPLDGAGRAAPPLLTEDTGAGLSADDRQLLSLLVAGVADKAIASRLQLSRRTVQRRIQRLMEHTGAATRMQLAWLAGRNELI